MVNYGISKIYKIEPTCDHPEEDIYIGSTTKKYLSQRMDTHRNNYKLWKDGKTNKTSSYDLFDKYGIDNCVILLIENCKCETIDELRSREGHFIKTMKCVNKCVAGRSKKESDKNYYENNKERCSEKSKIYYETNKTKILENVKLYGEINKSKIKEKRKQYCKQKYICVCGCEYTISNKARHEKSKKHVNYMLKQNQ